MDIDQHWSLVERSPTYAADLDGRAEWLVTELAGEPRLPAHTIHQSGGMTPDTWHPALTMPAISAAGSPEHKPRIW
jgi:hypothetical protein